MTYYPDLGFSSCQVAAAVAEAAIHELRVNVGFPGFPQIDVSGDPDGFFTVVMSWKNSASAQFQLSEAEVISAVDKFTSGAGYDPVFSIRCRRPCWTLRGRHLDTRVYRRLEVSSLGGGVRSAECDDLMSGAACEDRRGKDEVTAPGLQP